ncbi:alpha-amylase family glycosyl hydrolase [Salinimonas chungwhensis]|uniref:alpha-amylase family glycosyl hydrolase n=1 Tax=Salinimonas chungwhensis TaxID=265425 RepID=UPI0003637659|nr:alpha-amylase family glycosyl hydrolase [Salinimonas chungwhensis]
MSEENRLHKNESASSADSTKNAGKPVVYQVFTRLFGNTNTTNKPWGTLAENGVGKFDDFTDTALTEIRKLGVSHIWYTGVPHHALVTDYTEYGISQDDPDVVKGRAGSPYAVKDYYSVNPDLATNPAKRLEEFEALIARTHAHDMKVIIDIVPNHVARDYESLDSPSDVSDFGANDDTTVTYARDNNFYYVVNEDFAVPQDDNYIPLGGDSHPLADGKFVERPAKWTGNGARAAQPSINDWYETVKINYGVRPDGSYDFPRLPAGYANKSFSEHAAFWQGKSLPDSWYKFRDIAHYWLDKGVDGFRFDMAEMVPVEFWSFLNSSIKMKNPEAFLLAEVYQPAKYRTYLHQGKMDYLYDKVGFYDTLKTVMQGDGDVSSLLKSHQQVSDIAPSMLHFLENHDEQRIASPEFAGDASKGKPAMVVSSLISASPIMLYFGQEVGEDGSEETGFGDPSRTTIFDYAGVPAHQRWMNNGAFDGGQLSADEKALRNFYQSLLTIAATNPAVNGELISLHDANLTDSKNYTEQQLAFIRAQGDNRLLVVTNFSDQAVKDLTVTLPPGVVKQLSLRAEHPLRGELDSGNDATFKQTENNSLAVTLSLRPNGSQIFSF